jgi:3-oxoadipate enol-lactonase
VPVLDLKDTQIYYELVGPNSAPVLVFSNSLGTNLEMWQPQISTLQRNFRVLRYDTRGHGQSAVTPGPYSIEQLADDVVAMLDQRGVDRASFCGLSMGGMIGMFLAARVPHRLHKLVLSNTTPKIGTAESWNDRIETVRQKGMGGVVDGILERWYTPPFRTRSPATVEWTRQMLLHTPPDGYCACCAAIRDADLWHTMATLPVPTLIIAGAKDPATSASEGRRMAEHIPGSQYLELAAAHLSNIEAKEAFTMAVARFLAA